MANQPKKEVLDVALKLIKPTKKHKNMNLAKKLMPKSKLLEQAWLKIIHTIQI